MRRNLYIGVAGWSYPEWKSLLGTSARQQSFSELMRLSEAFNLAEITSAYYHPPDARTARQWLAHVQGNPHFLFTARLWQKLVREHSIASQTDVKIVKRGLSPLLESQRLGALVMPFSQSFRCSESNEEWLVGLLDAFVEYPVVVELHHRSWQNCTLVPRLRQRNVGLAFIDQPRTEGAIELGGSCSSRVAYLRFNGQNQQQWANSKAGRDERLDYYYSDEEVASLAKQVNSLAREAEFCFAVMNNYPHGQALANALQLQFRLSGARVEIPVGLLERFPDLAAIAGSEKPRQIELF